MANVFCSSNISFSVNEEEKEILQKSHDILETIRHSWYMRDDNAWDDDRYWEIENAVEMLENIFGCNKNPN